MDQDTTQVIALLTLEYERLKEEQKVRIGMRDNLIYVSLAAMAAVIASAVQAGGRPEFLLLLPPVAFLLGWTYQANDQKISDIGRHIREEIAPRLTELTGAERPVFGWETGHRRGPRRLGRKLMQLLVDLLAFAAAPLAAVIVAWTSADLSGPLVAISVAEVVLVLVLAGHMVRDLELRD